MNDFSLEDQMKANLNTFKDAADAAGSKIDYAAKHRLPASLVLGMDNRELPAAEISPFDFSPQTVAFYAANPLAAAVYAKHDEVKQVENVFTVAAKQEAEVADMVAKLSRQSAQGILTSLDRELAPQIFSTEFLRFALVKTKEDAANYADADKYNRLMKFAAFMIKTNDRFFEDKDTWTPEFIRQYVDGFAGQSGVDMSDIDVERDIMKNSQIDWAQAYQGFTVFRLINAVAQATKRSDQSNPWMVAAIPKNTYAQSAEMYKREWAAIQGQTMTKLAGDTTLAMIPLMTELAFSAPVAVSGRAATAGTLADRGILQGGGMLAKLGRGLVTAFGGEVARTGVAYAPKILLDAVDDASAGALKLDQASGELYMDLTPEQHISFGDAVLKSATKNLLANYSEQLGYAVGMAGMNTIPAAVRERIGRTAAKWMVKNAKAEDVLRIARKVAAPVTGALDEARRLTSFDGAWMEVGEEVFNQVLDYGATQTGNVFGIEGLKQIGADSPFLSAEEFQATVFATMIASGAFGLPSAVANTVGIAKTRAEVKRTLAEYASLPDAKSRVMAEVMIRAAHESAGSTDRKVIVPASDLNALFQENPDLLTALEFGDGELDLIRERASEGGDVALDLPRLMAGAKFGKQDDAFAKVLNLAVTRPGGLVASKVDPKAVERAIAADPAGVRLIADEVAKADAVNREQVVARRALAAKQSEELDVEAARLGDELKSSKRRKSEIEANVALWTSFARTVAGYTDINPADVLRDVSVRQIAYADFEREMAGEEEVPFQTQVESEDGIAKFGDSRINWDNADGLGVMGDNRNINYRGFQIEMTAKEFRKLTPKGRTTSDLTELKGKISSGEGVGSPTVFAEWNKEKKQWEVIGHEGRSRADAIIELYGNDTLVPVHVIPYKLRAHDISEEMLHAPFVGEGLAEYSWAPAYKYLNRKKKVDGDIRFQGTERRLGAMAGNVISLFEHANESTFAHESMHYFMNFLDRMEAEGLLAGTPLEADLEEIRRYSTSEDGNFDPEKIAKAWELYLIGGQAPNKGLERAFANFRRWLLDVYRTVRSYFDGVVLTPEIKAIFDRWLGGEELAERELADNEVIAMHRAYELLGTAKADRRAVLPWAEGRRREILAELDKARAVELAKVRRAARAEATAQLKKLKFASVYDYVAEQGRLDADTVKAAYGKEVLNDLRRKGLIAKRPRSARPGETFADPQERRDKTIGLKRYHAGFERYLEAQHYLISVIRQNNYSKIVPDDSFLVMPEQFGSFMAKTGQPSDLAARELSGMAGYEVTEAELVETLTDTTLRDLRRNYAAASRAERSYWEKQAEADIRLSASNELQVVAVDNQYESGDAMVEDLLNNPTPSEYIDQTVARAVEMFEENFYSSEVAMASEAMLEQNENLIKALEQKTGKTASNLGRAEFRQAAQQRILSMSVREAERSDIFVGSIRRKAREAAEALNKGDYQTALEAARIVHVNSEILRQMHGVQKEIARIADRVAKKAKAPKSAGKYQVAGDVHYFYRLLARECGFTRDAMNKLQIPAMTLDELLTEYDFDLTAADLPQGNYKAWTVSDFVRFADFMNSLHRFGADLVSNAEEARMTKLAEAKTSILAQLEPLGDAAQSRDGEKMLFEGAAVAGMLQNLLGLCRRLDGFANVTGSEVGGAVERLLYNPLHQADGRSRELTFGVMEQIMPHVEVLRAWALTQPKKLVNLPELPADMKRFRTDYWTPEMAIIFALNWGNTNNRKKLLDGYKWTEEQGRQVLGLFNTAELWQAIQGIWDGVDTLYPAVDQAWYESNYQHVYKEGAAPFEVELGDGKILPVKGGYMPLAYDSTISFGRMGLNEVELSGAAKKKNAIPSGGMTKLRQERTGLPVLLSFGGLAKHIENAARYAAFKTPMRNVQAVLRDADVQRELKAKLGGRYGDFMKLIANVGNPDKPDYGKAGILRAAAVAKGLWFNIPSSFKQLSTLAVGAEAVGGYMNLLAGQMAFYADGVKKNIDLIHSKSVFMRDRFRGKDRDIRGELAEINFTGATRFVRSLRDAGFYPIKMMDTAAVYPVWLASYHHSVASGKSEADAVLIADKLIADTQGAGRAIDMSAAQLNKTMSFMMMFSGPSVAQWNRNLTTTSALAAGKIGTGRYFYTMVGSFAIPAMIQFTIAAAAGNMFGGDDKKKKKKLMALYRELGGMALMGVPLFREIPDVVFSDYSGRAGSNPLFGTIEPFGAAVREMRQGKLSKATWTMLEAAAALYRVPVLTVYKRLERIAKNYGETD